MWDMDGTIMNTNEVIVESWQHTARHYGGEELSIEAILSSFGETIVYTASCLWPDVDPREVAEYYREFQEAHMEELVSLFPGIPEILRALKNKGYSVSMVTSRTSATLAVYMKKFELEDCFDVVITCDDVTEHKPDPRPIDMCIEKLEEKYGCRIDKDECLMIGDTRFDIGCAHNAGVESVLIGWSHPIDERQLEDIGWVPTYRIETPSDVWEVVG